jgi:hypothetical protein
MERQVDDRLSGPARVSYAPGGASRPEEQQ